MNQDRALLRAKVLDVLERVLAQDLTDKQRAALTAELPSRSWRNTSRPASVCHRRSKARQPTSARAAIAASSRASPIARERQRGFFATTNATSFALPTSFSSHSMNPASRISRTIVGRS
jgi:hypothetical protein